MSKKSSEKVARPQDVLPKHFLGGEWKSRSAGKNGPHGHRRAPASNGLGGRYLVIPPIEGWSGGDPVKNGYKPGAVK